MTLKITGEGLTVEDIVKVARNDEKIEVDDKNWEMMKDNRKVVESLIERKVPIYGVSTGIGELADVFLTPEQIKNFQKYLIYSHAAGCGEPAAIDDVRAALLTRINVLSKGRSGIRPVVVRTMVDMMNKGVTPVMCQKGSVGASGDLSPMAQGALVLAGEGEAFYKGKKMPGKEAMDAAGIETIQFEARDGLACINGSNLITGMGALQMHDAIGLLKTSEISAALTLEALQANMKAYDERIHTARGYQGAVRCARNIRRVVEGSEILARRPKKVQDAYSLRSTPQVMSAVRDTIDYARQTFETEMNWVGNNPLFFPDDGGVCLTGANFQGTPMAFALEYLGIAMTTVGVLSERRFNRLTNPALSNGLPPFLIIGAGMFSGMMLAQYTSAALVCENRVLSTPAATGSIPTAADQEDFVSMGMTTAIKTKDILKNLSSIIAIELMGAAQGLEFRKPRKPARASQVVYDLVRKYVEPMEEDRPLYNDINKLTEIVKKGEFVKAVEKEIGELE